MFEKKKKKQGNIHNSEKSSVSCVFEKETKENYLLFIFRRISRFASHLRFERSAKA